MHFDKLLQEQIEPFVENWDYYLQTANGMIKRITLPVAWYCAVRYLDTHRKGRSPSYLDTETRNILNRSPNLTYSEALCEVLQEFSTDPENLRGYWDEHYNNAERYKRDETDFWIMLDVRENAWREATGDDRVALPPIFN